MLGAIDGGFLEERGDVFLGKLREGIKTAAGSGEGLGETRKTEGGVDFIGRENDAGDVAVATGAGEEGGAGFGEDDVENDVVEEWTLTMAVEFPAAGIEIELDGAGVNFTIDLDGGGEEIGTGTAIPFAGRDNADFLAVAGGVLTGEMPGEPMGLDFDFVEIWSRQILCHKVGGWGAIIEELRVGHFFLAGGGAGGSRIVMRPSTDLISGRSS